MRRFLPAVFAAAVLAGVARAEENRYQVVQGALSTGAAGEAGKVSVVLKVDTTTGDTWRLVSVSNGYWWLPVKNGVLPEKKAPPADEKPADTTAAPPK